MPSTFCNCWYSILLHTHRYFSVKYILNTILSILLNFMIQCLPLVSKNSQPYHLAVGTRTSIPIHRNEMVRKFLFSLQYDIKSRQALLLYINGNAIIRKTDKGERVSHVPFRNHFWVESVFSIKFTGMFIRMDG